MGEYDLISELCDICVTLLRVVEAQEGALLQLGAVADAEGMADKLGVLLLGGSITDAQYQELIALIPAA